MAGKWINGGPSEDESQQTSGNFLISALNVASSAVIAITAYLVGAKFSSIFLGLLSYFLIEIVHCIMLLLLIDKDALQKIITHHTLHEEVKMKDIIIEQNNKHAVESLCSVFFIYIILHIFIGI